HGALCRSCPPEHGVRCRTRPPKCGARCRTCPPKRGARCRTRPPKRGARCRTRPPKRGARRRMTRTQLRRLIEAHDEVWLGWWPRLTGLTASQARRTLEGRWPSVLAMTDHMVDTERYWQDRLEPREGRDRPIRGETMAQLERAWTRLRDRRLAWLDRADLRQRVWFTAADGNVVHV